jgi:hypothetical protein
VFDEEARVFDDEKAGGAGLLRGLRVRDSQLKPKRFGANCDGGSGDGRNILGAAEDIDDVDGRRHIFEACIGFLAEDFALVGVDGNDAVADGLEIGGDFVGGTTGIRGETDDGNGFGLAEKIGDGIGRLG